MYSCGGIAIAALLISLDLERSATGFMAFNTAMQHGCAMSQFLLAALLADQKWGSYRDWRDQQEKPTVAALPMADMALPEGNSDNADVIPPQSKRQLERDLSSYIGVDKK